MECYRQLHASFFCKQVTNHIQPSHPIHIATVQGGGKQSRIYQQGSAKVNIVFHHKLQHTCTLPQYACMYIYRMGEGGKVVSPGIFGMITEDPVTGLVFKQV